MSTLNEDLLSIVSDASSYAVDGQDADLTYRGRKVARIDEQTFFDQFYVDRRQSRLESRLTDLLATSHKLVIVKGREGSGKTSLIYSAVRALNSSIDARVIALDIKRDIPQRFFGTDAERIAPAELFDQLRMQVESHLFPTPADVTEMHACLLAGLLDSEPQRNASGHNALLRQLFDISIDVQTACNAAAVSTRDERRAQILQYLQTNPVGAMQIRARLRSLLSLGHVMLAAALMNPNKRHVLIMDNVDRLAVWLQTPLLSDANDTQLALGTAGLLVVSVRQETLRRLRSRTGGGADVVKVLSLDPDICTPVMMPQLDEDHLQKVLDRRYMYVEQLFKECTSARVGMEFYCSLHRRALGEFVQNAAHRLFNHSVRQTQVAYSRFVSYIFRLRDAISDRKEGHRKADGDEIGFDGVVLAEGGHDHLTTLFFMWLRSQHQQMGTAIGHVCLVHETDRIKGRTFHEVASLDHLLLACVRNLTQAQGNGGCPVISMVCEELGRLGFPPERVCGAIRNLLTVPGEHDRLLELASETAGIDDVIAQSTEQIRLTDLGDGMLTRVYCTVGYIWNGIASDFKSDPTSGRA